MGDDLIFMGITQSQTG